jgi:hypothetical protein
LLAGLESEGWKVKKDLKVPHATSPNGDIRLWFKPQAIWMSGGIVHDLAHARSIFVDPRGTTVKGLINHVYSL